MLRRESRRQGQLHMIMCRSAAGCRSYKLTRPQPCRMRALYYYVTLWPACVVRAPTGLRHIHAHGDPWALADMSRISYCTSALLFASGMPGYSNAILSDEMRVDEG